MKGTEDASDGDDLEKATAVCPWIWNVGSSVWNEIASWIGAIVIWIATIADGVWSGIAIVAANESASVDGIASCCGSSSYPWRGYR